MTDYASVAAPFWLLDEPQRAAWLHVPHPVLGSNLVERPCARGEYTLLSCPLCEYKFDEFEKRHTHYEKRHRPEDAGLSPIRTRPVQGRLSDFTDGGRVVES